MKKLIPLFLLIPIIALAQQYYDTWGDKTSYEQTHNVECIAPMPAKCTLEECEDKHNKCNTCVRDYICTDGKVFRIRE